MAAEGATQALVAAFFFGIVVNAASAALVLYLKGHGLGSIFRDSQRLVLILFLLSAALWAQIDFITIVLDVSRSPTSCQVGIIFSTVFDQFARFSIEQFLLWGLSNSHGAKLSAIQLIPQVLVLARFLAGAVFTGFTRPQTDTFCVATTSAPPVGFLVAALDGAIILLLIVRAYSTGGVAKENRDSKGNDADRARTLMSVLLGLVFWTGTSVPLLLGIRSLALATRTALPAGGLLVLIVSVAAGAETLLTPRTANSRPPEAPSPRRINISRDISSSDTDYPPSRFEDLKEAAIRSSTTFVNPREAPRVKDETRVGLRFGTESALQGGPLTPLPTVTAPVSNVARNLDRSASRKKSVVGFSKGKLAISHPILQENSGQNPLHKIAVMDLKAAAIADRERRARMHEEESMPVSRSAGPLMGMTPEEVLKRGLSLKRKELASVSTRESIFPGALQPEAVAFTTSTQLSPGGEETRRRSPRPSLQEEPIQARQPSPVHAVEPVKAPSESPQDRPLTILQPLLKANIRPSRMLPPSPKAPPPEPTKTPLQRRPTIGLPSNPRARGLKVAEEAGSQHRTILFVNNIEYNDPHVVEAIIKGAGNTATKPASASAAPVPETPGTSGSVVNRPRPIPRKPADSPAQSSPATHHRRSKSGGSLIGRKSLLASSPGSPTRLPPLPTLPRSAAMPTRPLPNETRSMTFEEKVTLLFPSPPSGNATKRRSSVPEVPRIPVSYLDMDSSPGEQSDHRRSNRTTKTSLRTESVLEVDEIPRLPGKIAVNTTDEAGSSWLRAFGVERDDGRPRNTSTATQASGKRGSSPVIPQVPRVSAWTETTYEQSEDEATNWSPINSPELAVSVPVIQKLGLPPIAQMPVPRGSQLSFADNRSRETLPIMLDTSTMQQADLQEFPVPEIEAVATPELPTWHRRVGDECPTFSDRKEKTKSRRMSPPAPLSLNTMSTKKILAIQVEPSPLESPAHAIQQIQAQLKKLDELDRGSPQSASRRLALLEDLEREMGLQAEHWQEIKHDMGRDSLSSMQTSSPAGQDSRRESVASNANAARNSIRQSIGAERRAPRVARLQDNGSLRIPDATVRNSGSPKMSKWQKRLTEAQMDYMDAQLHRTSNVNFLQLTRAQLASPTPPDSDDSDDEVPPVPSLPVEVAVDQAPEAGLKRPSLLWTPSSKESGSDAGFLWTAVSRPPPETEAPLPGLSVRPAQRKESAPLQIESSQLWRKPYNTANRAASGLWRPVWASAAPPAEPVARASKAATPSQKPPRPVTQRPPRRNKRVTLLPDILESPEPLPDKRGTLGIFQFPWGEKSDTASIRPRPSMYMAMPGTMTSGGPSSGMAGDARSRQLEPTEYSSSFFDDYDDDEDDNEGLDSDEEDTDDAFDETTLWEIASLLNTDAIPSRDSLLPPSGSVLDDYVDELTSDEEGQSSREQSIVIGLGEPRELVLEQQRDSATIESSTLLLLEDALEIKTTPKSAARIGLPANPKPSSAPAPQAKRAASPAASEATPAPEMSRMARHIAEIQRAETANRQGSACLWYPSSQVDEPLAVGGLFVPRASRSGYRGTSEEPAAMYISRKPRPVEQKPVDRLTSTQLWASGNAEKKRQRNWILGAAPNLSESRIQRPQASREAWKSALHQAIAASYPPTKKLTRVTATLAQWKAALQEAISLSARQPASFNSAVRHPVFAASSLATRSEWFHPAATGYTYDVSVVHPVFFGSLAITCPEDAVHPAISAYAAKKLRRQRKDEPRAQIRALEQGGAVEEAYTSTAAPPPIPPAALGQQQQQQLSRRSAADIQAQIEALEQERLFVERAALEEYRRRTTTTSPSMSVGVGVGAVPEVTEVVDPLMMMSAGPVTVQDLQRRLSQRIRQSLVFGGDKAESKPAGVVSRSVSKSEGEGENGRLAVTPGQGQVKPSALLWTPAPRPAAVHSSTAAGLWSVASSSTTTSWTAQEEEDALAATQRARRRRVVQKKQRRQEILVQIAAVESGVNPFVDFGGMGLWVYGGGRVKAGERERGLGRDWLHSVCVRRTRGVVLRY